MIPFGGEVLAIVPSISRDTTNAPDLIGGNDGTLNGGVSYVRQRDEIAAVGHWDFDGTSGTEIITGNIQGASFPDPAAFSMACWVNVTVNKSYGMFMTHRHSAGELDLRLFSTTLRPEFQMTASIQSPDPLVIGQWAHLCGTSNNGAIALYVNGKLKASTSTTSRSLNDLHPVRLARRSDGFELDCLIDDARYFSRALAASEVKELASRHAYQRRVRDVA